MAAAKRGNPPARPLKSIHLNTAGDVVITTTSDRALIITRDHVRLGTAPSAGMVTPYPTELAQVATRLAHKFGCDWQVKRSDGSWTTMPERVAFIFNVMSTRTSEGEVIDISKPTKATTTRSETTTTESLVTSETNTNKESSNMAGSLDEIIRNLIDERIRNTAGALDMTELDKHIDDAVADKIANVQTKRIEIKMPDASITLDKHTHPMFGKVLAALMVARQSTKWPYLVGPAGTGKSTMGEHLSEALGVPFYTVSCQPGMMMHDLIGYKRPTDGVYEETEFVTLMRNGGTGLIDEMDKAHPGILAGMNGALAQGYITLPTGERLKIHDQFYFIAGANTFGTGPTAQYVGSTQLDAATLNRFARIPVDYDRAYELARSQGALGTGKGAEWCKQIELIRANRDAHKIDAIISTRDVIGCAVMVQTGQITPTEAVEWTILAGLTQTHRDRLMANVSLTCLEGAAK